MAPLLEGEPPHDQVRLCDPPAALLGRPPDRSDRAYPDHAPEMAYRVVEIAAQNFQQRPPICGCSTCGGTPTRNGFSIHGCSATPPIPIFSRAT